MKNEINIVKDIWDTHISVFNSFDLTTYNGHSLEDETKSTSLFSTMETIKAIIKYKDVQKEVLEKCLQQIKSSKYYSNSNYTEKAPSDEYKFCNHHHELTENYSIVDFGTGEFVANNEAIPLLKALNEVGLTTRTHHIDSEIHAFISIILDNVDVEITTVNEGHSTREKFNGKKELLLRWTK